MWLNPVYTLSMQDITAEFSHTELHEPVELRVVPQVVVGCKTDIGLVREINEDKFEYFLTEDRGQLANRGHVFVVCDGMGGHAAGQIASELSAKTFIETYYQHLGNDPIEAARATMNLVQRFILNIQAAIPQRKGMGTTMEVVALCQDRAIIAHIGDSRIYRQRNGVLEQITKDHSWVQEMVDANVMSEAEAEQHPNRNALTRCIGHDQDFFPDIFTLDLAVGDQFLLCSDGVTKCTSFTQMQTIMSSGHPSKQAWDLVLAAMAGGGSDNATALVVHVTDLMAAE